MISTLIFIFSERPEWYLKTLKNLIYESSSLTNPLVNDLLQAEKKLFKEEDEDGELSEIKQVYKEHDTKEEKPCKDVITKESCIEVEDTKENDYEDDFEEMSKEEEEESQSENSSSTLSTSSSTKSTSSSTTKSTSTTSSSTSISGDSENETDSSELSNIDHQQKSILDKPTVSIALRSNKIKASCDEDKSTANSITAVDKIAGDQPEAALAVTNNLGSEETASVKCSTNTTDGVFHHQESCALKPATKSMLKMISSESSIKKTVSFKMIVRGKFFMKNSTLKENSEDFVLALKQPQQKKWKVPSRRVYKAPIAQYHPVSRTPVQMIKIKHFGKLPDDEVDTPEQKITAADIFGSSKDSKIFDDLPGQEDNGLNGNLDDAMDFLLNM